MTAIILQLLMSLIMNLPQIIEWVREIFAHWKKLPREERPAARAAFATLVKAQHKSGAHPSFAGGAPVVEAFKNHALELRQRTGCTREELKMLDFPPKHARRGPKPGARK